MAQAEPIIMVINIEDVSPSGLPTHLLWVAKKKVS